MKSVLPGIALSLMISGLAQADITIAAVGPMSGQYAPFGAQLKAGTEMALAKINAAGGVNGEKVVLSVHDDACDPKQAVTIANKVVASGAPLVVGHICSSASIAASGIYAEEGVVQISPASTNPAFTDERPGPGVFRVCGRDDQQGEVAGKYLAAIFAGKKIAFIHDQTNYGKGLADATLAVFQASGGKEALYEAFTPGEDDYSALVSKLKSEGIEVLYLGGYHTEAAYIVSEMRDQGLETILVSGDALVTDEFWQITGDAGEGTLMTFAPDPRRNAAASAIVEKFRNEGIEPEGYVLYAYAAVQAWAQAANTANSTELNPVSKALTDGVFDTVLGPLSFDEKGDVNTPGYVWYEWEDGKYDYMN